MNCASCGVQNVEFATTCYACGQPLGGARRIVSAATTTPHAPQHHVPSHAPPQVKVSSGAAMGLVRLLVFGAVAFLFFREPITALVTGLRSVGSESPSSVETSPPPAPEQAIPEAPPAPPPPPPEAARSSPEEYPAAEAPAEINGFKLTLFEWEQAGPAHFGDVVKGRSQISGFEVSPENRIDITMRFTFRDPRGKVLEKSNPSRLDQPVESDTLFSSFDYTIPEKGPAGDYDLEIRVDDAVSGRSARFHRTITAMR